MQTKTVSSKKAQEIKNAAIAIGVYGNGSKRLGDIAVTNKGLVWSNGNSKAAKDITVKWDAFIGFMQAQLKTPVKAPGKKAPARKATAKTRASASANGKKIGAAKKAPVKKAAASKASRKKVH